MPLRRIIATAFLAGLCGALYMCAAYPQSAASNWIENAMYSYALWLIVYSGLTVILANRVFGADWRIAKYMTNRVTRVTHNPYRRNTVIASVAGVGLMLACLLWHSNWWAAAVLLLSQGLAISTSYQPPFVLVLGVSRTTDPLFEKARWAAEPLRAVNLFEFEGRSPSDLLASITRLDNVRAYTVSWLPVVRAFAAISRLVVVDLRVMSEQLIAEVTLLGQVDDWHKVICVGTSRADVIERLHGIAPNVDANRLLLITESEDDVRAIVYRLKWATAATPRPLMRASSR